MAKFETLPTIAFKHAPCAKPTELPLVVHLDDPALNVMIDFNHTKPLTISPNKPIDEALEEMKISGVHMLLVLDQDANVMGLISTEDILGEKPINIIQEGRVTRGEILVKQVMIPESEIMAFDIDTLLLAKVGNVINTLKKLKEHYALVLKFSKDKSRLVCGLFSSSQISKQLHADVNNHLIGEARTLSELQKRHS